MTTPGWRRRLVVHGVDLARLVERGPRAVPNVPVVAAFLETIGGDLQFALHVGEQGEPVILSVQVASQHIVNMRELLVERLRLAGQGRE